VRTPEQLVARVVDAGIRQRYAAMNLAFDDQIVIRGEHVAAVRQRRREGQRGGGIAAEPDL
jgi:hypothetical protein